MRFDGEKAETERKGNLVFSHIVWADAVGMEFLPKLSAFSCHGADGGQCVGLVFAPVVSPRKAPGTGVAPLRQSGEGHPVPTLCSSA